jgi:UDP-N-acetylglucosamine--N-acetylmuramyl-(pentapeptide) pyrophosphoryl-undecaprenol N-acetylglucosamine transferase
MTVGECIQDLVEKYVVIHQTGENDFRDFERLTEIKSRLPAEHQARYIVKKYIYPSQIGFVYKAADMVIGRAGANTVLELIACNKPSLLIPLPHGQAGEQLTNARLIESLGLGVVLEQKDLSTQSFLEMINTIIRGIDKYHISQDIIDKYIFDDAAIRIVRELTAQYEKKKAKKR